MQVPTPVNLSQLSGILAKSRQVMDKVQGTKPQTQSGREAVNENYGSGGYSEEDERDIEYEQYSSTPTGTFDPTNVQDYTEEQVINSKLPQAIKEAMLKNRIPRLSSPPSKFTAEELSKITGAPIRKPQSQQINETVQPRQYQNSDMITVSKSELKEMINEGISTFFKQVYDKTLTEETIKKTINLLIKEGKIATKRK